ncbi:potassium-transporting ATPase subunit KdpA [Chitinophagaceae bacterium LB-8]|uniref:Potassium-transporting ATPase potassium-binding subunit n=1 Tax=Paraflavisolibacter caeni TaxID=2982496 RepID=A0A9X3B784_9BACT|nr:potassium-transporting ATPase subunit KdpA [Paraflavisolibacter caeni]MCU7548930.1 potassium-transporting ATPase subunit KdpA [Paraflavisolibacter caeni]
MNTELLGVIITYVLTVLLAIPLGKYIAKTIKGERTILGFMAPVERFIFKICGIDPNKEMNWKQHLKALLTINFIWFIYGFIMLITQGSLFLNPDGNPSQTPDLAFNTVISFIVNCNLQHYSGESGLTYLTQLYVVMFFQFVSAATGIAALFVLFKALRDKVTDQLGNFWVFFVQSITRLLLPLSIIVAIVLAFNGTPTSFEGKDSIVTLQGDSVQVSRGPAAGMIAIKQLGTNGGGWFGVNSAHPLENPNYFTNVVENIAILLIPIALVFALGYYLNRRKLAKVIFGVMTVGFLFILSTSVYSEIKGNPALSKMGVLQPTGSMEGKEARFGPAASALWGISTTATSNGSVNAMHDSMTPMSGAMQMLDMMINAFYGGIGVGILNYFVFLIVAVFISGLMVGRTPEFLGRKIEAKEMKIASVIALLHPLLILAGTALSSYIIVHHPEADWAVKPANWLNNPGYHGFGEMLYEYTSSAANNGSGFEGLGDNNIFWNVTTGFVLILGRFLPIVGPIAIAGILAQKKYIPESAGTLKSDSYTFGLMTFAVIVIIAALAFFPALTLGPLAEHFSLK